MGKAINVRLDDEMSRQLARLIGVLTERAGFRVSQADVVRAGLNALDEKYPSAGPAPEPEPSPKPGRRPRKK